MALTQDELFVGRPENMLLVKIKKSVSIVVPRNLIRIKPSMSKVDDIVDESNSRSRI